MSWPRDARVLGVRCECPCQRVLLPLLARPPCSWYIFNNRVVNVTPYLTTNRHPGWRWGGVGITTRLCVAVWHPCLPSACCSCWHCTAVTLLPAHTPCAAGGNAVIVRYCGKDATGAFNSAHRTGPAVAQQEAYMIGTLAA